MANPYDSRLQEIAAYATETLGARSAAIVRSDGTRLAQTGPEEPLPTAPSERFANAPFHNGTALWVGIDRPLTDSERRTLRFLARQAETRLALLEASPAIPKEQKLLRLVTDRMPVRVAYVDRDFRFRFMNDAYEAITGLVREGALGQTLAEALGEPVFAVVRPNLERAFAGETHTQEFDAPYDGNPRRVVVTYVPDVGPDGEVRGVVVQSLDVTEQRAAESEAAAERARRDRTLHTAGVGVFDWDLRAGILRGNDLMGLFYNVPDAERGTPIEPYLQAMHPDDREPSRERIARALAEGASYETQYRVRGLDGRERWVLGRGDVEREDGVAVRVSGVVLDVTRRVESERALDEARTRLDHTLANAEVATFDWNLANDRVQANPLLAHFFGVSEEDAQGGPAAAYFAAIHPDDRARTQAEIGKSLESGGRYEMQYRVTGADGKERWVLARGDATLDAHGKPLRLTGVVLDVTERARAEAAIRSNWERYQTLFNSLEDGFCVIEVIFDEEGRPVDYRFKEINAAFEGQTDITPAQVAQGLTVRQIVPNHEERWFKVYGHVARTGESVHFEDRAEALGRFYEVHAFRLGDDGSHEVGVLFRDATQRRHAAEERERLVAALADERARFTDIVRDIPAFVAVLEGEDLTFTYGNEAYYRLIGERPIVGKPLHEALPEVADQGYFETLTEVRTTGIPYLVKERPVSLQLTSGGPMVDRLVDLTYLSARSVDGTIYGVLTHGVDVTEDVLARQAIAEREELFRTVFEQAPDDAILVMDGDRTLTAWNPAAERMTGWTAQEAIGQSADMIFTPEDRAQGDPEGEAQTADREDKAPDERWHLRKDGSRFWGSGTMNALHDAEGRVRGYLKVLRDATERHEIARALEARVAERTAELKKAVEEAEGFNYSISHDLRSPLRAMVSTSSILLEDLGPRLDDEHRELLERQSHNAIRMGRLIDELLRLSRLARAEVKRETVDVTAKARSVFDELADQGRANGCRLETQEGMIAQADRNLLRTVFYNLLGNACKFSPNGGTIRVREQNGVFSVSDEGVGFDMAHAGRMFLPFERLVPESEFEGTGIGLANVKRIVERHGGRVWAESEPGHGATFYFTLG